MEPHFNGQEQQDGEQALPKHKPEPILQSSTAGLPQLQQEQQQRHGSPPQRHPWPESGGDATEKQHQRGPSSSSAVQQLVRRRTLQSPKGSGWVQPQPEDEDFSKIKEEPRRDASSGPIRGPSVVSTEALSNGSTAAAVSEELRSSSSGGFRRRKTTATAATNSISSGAKDAASCAPWRVTLIVEAFDAVATGCPACLPGSAAANDDEEAATSDATAAAAHADDITRPGSSPGLHSRRRLPSISSASSTASVPSATSSHSSSRSSNNNNGTPDFWCCRCTQIWLEVYDLRGPGAPAELRLLSDSVLLPRFLSPPILLPRRIQQLQFRLFRRRPQQQPQLLQQHKQQLEWTEDREPLGIRAVLLPDAPSCVISCTYGRSDGPFVP